MALRRLCFTAAAVEITDLQQTSPPLEFPSLHACLETLPNAKAFWREVQLIVERAETSQLLFVLEESAFCYKRFLAVPVWHRHWGFAGVLHLRAQPYPLFRLALRVCVRDVSAFVDSFIIFLRLVGLPG